MLFFFTWRVSAQRTTMMMSHHVIHSVVGSVQLMVAGGDGRIGHWCQCGHRSGRIQHVQTVHCMMHLQMVEETKCLCRCLLRFFCLFLYIWCSVSVVCCVIVWRAGTTLFIHNTIGHLRFAMVSPIFWVVVWRRVDFFVVVVVRIAEKKEKYESFNFIL